MVDPDIEQQMAKFAPSSNSQVGAGSDIDPDAAAIVKSVLPQGGNEVRQVGPPDIDPDVSAIVEAKRNTVRATMYGVAGQNPDQAAEAQRIGREFGVSGEFVLRNMEDMKRMQAIRSVERRELMQQDPILARFLTNQDFAAIAHDDLDNLSTTERIYNNAVNFVNPKSWDTIKGRFQRGMDLVEMGRANDVMGLRAQWSPTPRASKDIAEEIRILPTDGGLIGSAAEVLGQMVAGIPEVAETTVAGATIGGTAGAIGGPLAPATMPAGMALGATAGLEVGMARVAGMSEAGNALQEMRTHAYGEIERLVGEGYSREQATNMVGYNDATAQKFATGVGIINGIIETASFEVMGPVARRLVGNVIREKVSESVLRPTMRSAIMQFAKDYSHAVATESGEEFLQQWVGIIGDEMQRKYGSNLPSRFNDEGSVKAAIIESFEAAIEGAKGAMLIGGIGPTGNLYFDMKRARQSVRQQAFFNRLTDAAKNSKVRQRNTPAYEQFIEGQVEGKDIDTVYIDAQQLNGVLRQAEINGVATAAELDQLLPGVRQQLAEALETNGDVTLPMSVWQGRVSGTKVGDALLPHVRLSPDAWSVTDRLEWEKKRAALMQEAEEILDEQEKTDTTARSSAAKVEDKIKQQLVESGAMDEKSAAANAKFYRSMIILLAKRAGMTPEQFQEQHGLQVIGPATRQAVEPMETAEQFDQAGQRKTDTPQFRAWFGNSKIVDENGKPLVAYRSMRGRTVRMGGDAGLAFAALDEANVQLWTENGTRPVRQVYVSAQNPFDFRDPDMQDWLVDAVIQPGFVEEYNRRLRESGDGDSWQATPEDLEYQARVGAWQLLETPMVVELLRQEGYDAMLVVEDEGQRVPNIAVFSDNQFKSINNQGTWSKQTADIFKQEQRQPKLMAVHNLSEENLAFADRMGGLAVPSIGVMTETAGGVEGFGEITLIGSQDMADPASSRVFESDAYSARFPRPEWPKVPVAKADAVVGQIRETAKQYGDTAIVDNTFDGMVNQPDAGRVADQWLRSLAIQALFLRAKGIDVPPVMREAKSLTILSWDAIDRLRPLYEAVNWQQSWDEVEASAEFAALQTAYANEVRQTYAAVAEEFPEGQFDRMMRFDMRAYQRMLRDLQTTERQVVAFGETQEALDNALQPYKAEFKTWVNNTIKAQFDAPFLRDGKLKRPYTLGNIVEVMASDKVKGREKGMTFGAGAARAAKAKEFDTLEEMREAASESIVSPEEYAAKSKETNALLEAYRNAMIDYTTLTDWRGKQDTWAALDGAMKAIARYGKRVKPNEQAMRQALAREGFDTRQMPAELIQQAIDAANALYTAPVPYFESKPQRAVKLNEFKGAVIPSTATAETRSILERNNIPFIEYGSEQSRVADVRQFAKMLERSGRNVLFQSAVPTSFYSALAREMTSANAALTAQAWKERLQGLINKGTIKEAEVEWSGIREWLDLHPPQLPGNRISNLEIKAFLDRQGIQITRRERSENREEMLRQAAQDAATDVENDLRTHGKLTERAEEVLSLYRVLQEANGDRQDIAEARSEIDDILWSAFYKDGASESGPFTSFDTYLEQRYDGNAVKESKWGNWRVGGGANYREVLLTLDEPRGIPYAFELRNNVITAYNNASEEEKNLVNARVKEVVHERSSFDNAVNNGFVGSEDFAGENWPDWLLAWRDETKRMVETRKNLPTFQGKHWEELNVVAHIRMTDRVNSDGKRILFIEEIQSDWAQRAADEGFANQREDDQAKLKTLEEQYQTAPSQQLADRITRLAKRLQQGKYEITPGPFVETTDAWLALAMKQILMEAVNGRYDGVMIINGKQAVTMYSQEQIVSSMQVVPSDPSENGTSSRSLTIKLKGENEPLKLEVTSMGRISSASRDERMFVGEPLSAVVGKDLAQKIMDIKPANFDEAGIAKRSEIFRQYSAEIQAAREAWVKISNGSAYDVGYQAMPFETWLANNGWQKAATLDDTGQQQYFNSSGVFEYERQLRYKHQSEDVARARRMVDSAARNAEYDLDQLIDQRNRFADQAYKLPTIEPVVLSGKDLRIGGKGLAAFYDQLVPIAFGKLLKKYGGGDIEQMSLTPIKGLGITRSEAKSVARQYINGDIDEVEVLDSLGLENQITEDQVSDILGGPLGDSRSRDAAIEAFADTVTARTQGQKRSNNNGFVVTDAMRDKVLPGLPLFQLPKFNLYSALAQQVSLMSDKPMSVDSWNQQIKNWLNRGLVKQDELEWSGFTDYLAMQQGKISKAMIMSFLNNNGVQVERVRLGEQNTEADDTQRQRAREFVDLFRKNYGTVTINGIELFDDDVGFRLLDGSLTADDLPADLQEPAKRWLAAVQVADEERKYKYAGPARYSDDKLVLPNGSNYRELLLTLPLATPEITVSENLSLEGETEFYELSFVEPVLQAQSRLRGFVAQNDDGSWRASFQGDMTERDSKDSAILWAKNQMSRVAPQVTKQTGFQSKHWEEFPNVVVHLRLNDRMDADGKKVLFVEEVQSDYGQKGRTKGFADNKKLLATQQRLAELQVAKSSLWPQARELLGLVDNLGFETAAEALAAIHEIRVDETTGVAMATSEDGGQWELAPLTAEQLKPLREYVNLEVEARNERKNLKSYSEKLPSAPFVQTTDGWLNLGLKQVLLEGIRGQYDRVAFITGEQSAQRYSLDKTVKMIVVTPRTNAVTQEKTRAVALELTNGTVLELGVNADGVVDNVNQANRAIGRRFLGEPLEEVVGKDMADKIMQTERGTFEGNDLKVGGEGMKAFYDSIVPTAVNKLLKKYGGGKLETIDLNGTTPLTKYDINPRGSQWALVDAYTREQIPDTPLFASGGAAEQWLATHGTASTHASFSITPEMVKRVADAGGLPLFQAAPLENARGGFDPRRMTMLLGQKADLSTFLHESAHWYLTVLSELAAKPGATAEVVQDINTLLAWFGVSDIAAWNRMTLEEQRKYHEQFAYNFEIYISQGRAPSVELEGMFERFAAWLKNVYATIRDDLNAIYRREYGEDLPILTGEVRQVMDRMLATDRQIREAEAIREMKPMFLTQEESGWDDATWKAYQDMVEEATQAAITDMTKASVRQMQWLSGARAKILRDLQARHRKLRKAMREEVTEQVRRSPLYRAMAFVRTGKSINPDGTAIKALGAHRLDMEAVRQMYVGNTTPMPDINALGTGGRGMMGANGLHPDTVAELFGYSSGDELVRALTAAKPMREEVNRIVDDRMLKEHGELSDPEQMEVVVQKALHNEARARFVAVELRFVTKATEPARIMVGAAKQAAKDILGRKRLRDIKAGQFEAAESKAARDAQTAYGRRQTPEQIGKAAFSRAYNEAKDNGADNATATATATAKAAQAIARATERQKEYQERYGNRNPQEVIVRAKRAQLINNQLAGQAAAATEEVAKKVRYLRRVLNAENVKKIGAEYTDQIAQLLEKFDLAQRSLKSIDTRTKFAEWLKAKRETGIEPEIPVSLQDAEKTNYKNLTLNDFRDLVMAVQQLEFMGKNHRKVLLAAQQKQFEEQRDEIVQSIKDNSKGRKSKARSSRNDQERRQQGLKGFAASHLNVATIVRILDGGKDNGPLWQYLIRTANERADMETTMRAQATEALAAIFKPILEKDKMGGKGMFFDSVNDSFNLEARMVIALNMGNAGNMQRLLDGEGWTMEQIRPILESLTAEQWEAVQKVWDFLESYRPLIAEKERRIYGKEPEWVEPQPITVRTKDGETLNLRGGYYPIKYDPRASRRSESLDLAEQSKRDMAAAFSSATTRRTFTKNRVEKVVNRPLLYTLDAMYNGVSDVIHDLSWHEWLIDANRLYRSDLFYDAINTTYGYEFVSQIGAWIKDVAAGEKSAQHSLEVALAFGRRNVGMMQMGVNVLSAALQVTGYSQSAVRVGLKWLGRGMSASIANPKAANELVNSKSKFMANRDRTQFREIAEIKNMIRNQSGAMRSMHANAYVMMLFMQRTVDVPTWIGAYEKARAEAHDEATAVALADQAVIDSQGSGMLKDLARVQRGGEFVKTFTMFYGFFNTTFNLAAVQTMTAKSKGKMLADWIMLFVVPAMMSEALRRLLVPRRDNGEDDDPTMLARELAAAQLSYLMGTMVGVREFGDVVPKRLFGVPARGYSGPASLRGVTIVSDVVGEVVDLQADRQFRKALINAIGARTGIPAVQINRTIDGLDAAIAGETKNPTAVLFGTRK